MDQPASDTDPAPRRDPWRGWRAPAFIAAAATAVASALLIARGNGKTGDEPK